MGHEAAKKSTERPAPIQRVKEKMSDRSFSVNALFCTMAGEMPMSVKMLKKAMMTVAMATMPKSSGVSRRASTPATTREMTMPLYLASAV